MDAANHTIEPANAVLACATCLPLCKLGVRPCSTLLALHRTAVLRHDEYGQETLLNLLLRSYLHYNLYDQVMSQVSQPALNQFKLALRIGRHYNTGNQGNSGWSLQTLALLNGMQAGSHFIQTSWHPTAYSRYPSKRALGGSVAS